MYAHRGAVVLIDIAESAGQRVARRRVLEIPDGLVGIATVNLSASRSVMAFSSRG